MGSSAGDPTRVSIQRYGALPCVPGPEIHAVPLCLPPPLCPSSRSGHHGPPQEPAPNPREDAPRRQRRAVTTCLFAAAFAAVDTVSQTVGRVQRAAGALLEGSFSPLRLLVALILSGAACWGFLALVDLAARRRGPRSQQGGDRRCVRWLALRAFLIPLTCWSLLYGHLWPMASMNDTAWILTDLFGAGAQHPITYRLMIVAMFRLGRLVGGDLTGVVLLSAGQMLLWATCVSGLVVFLDRKGASRGVTGSLIAYCALMPLVADYSFAVVVVVPADFALMRSNALPVVLIALALVVWWSRAHLRRALAVTALALVIIVVPSAMTAQSQHVEEGVGIPLQMVG